MLYHLSDRAPRIAIVAAASLVALTVAGVEARPDDWPQYRGPNFSGISRETGILKAWPASGPKVMWKTDLGDGYSGLVVVGGKLFTMYAADGNEYLGCFEAGTGKPVWKLRVDSNRSDEMGDGPRSTPTVDGEMVYAVGAKSLLVAAKAASGTKVWGKDLKAEFGAKVPRWGSSGSPLVDGDLVVVDAGGGPGKSLVALDKKTGATRWTSYTDKPGYSTPLPVTILATRQILSFAGSSLVSVSAADGTVLWSVPWPTDYDVNAAMPVFIPPDKVFISSSYDTGGAVYAVKRSGNKMEAEEVWKSRQMKNHFNSSIYQEGHLYGFDDGTLKCIEAATGAEKWRQRGFAKGSLLLADGHLIVLSEAGLLALVEATPEAYKEKARAQVLEGRTWTMPTLAGGKLYLRNQKVMVALDLAG